MAELISRVSELVRDRFDWRHVLALVVTSGLVLEFVFEDDVLELEELLLIAFEGFAEVIYLGASCSVCYAKGFNLLFLLGELFLLIFFTFL